MRGYVSEFTDRLQQQSRYGFAVSELIAVAPVARPALNAALRRLSARGRLKRLTPRGDFFVIVPLEHRSMGAPPAAWFLDDYMRHLGCDYYVALQSAAAWHGATHFAVMETQVMTSVQLRPIEIGRERIRFFTKANAGTTPTETRVVEGMTVRVSTPEATLLDLVRYTRGSGGLGRTATMLGDLAPKCRRPRLLAALEAADDAPSAQRLGYLFDVFGHTGLARAVARWLDRHRHAVCPLAPGAPVEGALRTPWNVIENVTVEAAT